MLRMRDMTSLRFAGVKMSTTGTDYAVVPTAATNAALGWEGSELDPYPVVTAQRSRPAAPPLGSLPRP